MKRAREGDGEGEWKEVGPRRNNKKKPKVATGTAKLTEFGDLSVPSEFWIGNTSPATEATNVKEVLMKCANHLLVDNFEVIDVRCLTKHDNPRSKSWKVSVPSKFKEIMLNPDMYFNGWTHRAFTPRSDTRREAPGGRPDTHRTAAGLGPHIGPEAAGNL